MSRLDRYVLASLVPLVGLVGILWLSAQVVTILLTHDLYNVTPLVLRCTTR